MQRPGLYYPYVHVRDDAWLKVAAMYWSSLRRIVPRGYDKHDSPTAQKLFDSSILRDEEPSSLLDPVAHDLASTLRKNADRLVRDYSIQQAIANWDGHNWSKGSAFGRDIPELGWIHVSKFPPSVVDSLTTLGLAQRGGPIHPIRGHGGLPDDWIGLHPTLAGAYMTVLAVRVSEAAHFEPLTDQADLRMAIPNGGVKSAVRLLIGRDLRARDPAMPVGNDTYVMLALQHARPRNLASVPIEKIIECRNDMSEELEGFRAYVDSRQTELAELAAIPDSQRQLEAFTEYIQQTIELQLQKLERGMQLHKLDPTRSLIVAGTFVAPAVATEALSAMGAPSAVAATVGAVAAVGNAWWQVGNIRAAAKSNSPVGYILDVRDRLAPRTLPAYIRKIFRGTYGRPVKA